MWARRVLVAQGGGAGAGAGAGDEVLPHLLGDSGWELQSQNISSQKTAEVFPHGGGPLHGPALVLTLIFRSYAVDQQSALAHVVEARRFSEG